VIVLKVMNAAQMLLVESINDPNVNRKDFEKGAWQTMCYRLEARGSLFKQVFGTYRSKVGHSTCLASMESFHGHLVSFVKVFSRNDLAHANGFQDNSFREKNFATKIPRHHLIIQLGLSPSHVERKGKRSVDSLD
jgi:hypothetical protein